MPPPKVLCVYPDPPGFSGQRSASELLMKTLAPNYNFTSVPVAGIPKTEKNASATLACCIRYALLIPTLVIACITKRPNYIHFSICQTRLTMLRDRYLLSLLHALAPLDTPFIGSIHGNLFTTWTPDSSIGKTFGKLLETFDAVTVLGPTQAAKILPFCSTGPNYRVLPNTCEIDPVAESFIIDKHRMDNCDVLHVGTLMEPKGYVDTIDAMGHNDSSYRLTVCGPFSKSKWDERFHRPEQGSAWMEKQLRKYPGRLRYRNRIQGTDKAALFRASHLFVFPTWYPVETQPLVLLEAMASGATIITTRAGEIPFMLDESMCVFVDTKSPQHIANAVDDLIRKPERRILLALKARERYLDVFSVDRHRQNWKNLLQTTKRGRR